MSAALRPFDFRIVLGDLPLSVSRTWWRTASKQDGPCSDGFSGHCDSIALEAAGSPVPGAGHAGEFVVRGSSEIRHRAFASRFRVREGSG